MMISRSQEHLTQDYSPHARSVPAHPAGYAKSTAPVSKESQYLTPDAQSLSGRRQTV